MKSHSNISQAISYIVGLFFLLLTVNPAVDAIAQVSGKAAQNLKTNPASKGNSDSQRFISIDFNHVDISVFIKIISELTKKNFVVDKRVNRKLNIISPNKISLKEP